MFSNKEIELIKKYYPENGSAKTSEIINDICHTNRTPKSIVKMAWKNNIKLNPDVISEFNKHRNQGVKGKSAGSVRKGYRKNGKAYYKMKTADGRWKTAGTVIWEKENGPIPKGYILIYLDGDNSNYQLNNLHLLDLKTYYQVVTNNNYKAGNSEITKSLIKFYELRNALGVDCWEWQKIQKKFERKYGKEFVNATS